MKVVYGAEVPTLMGLRDVHPIELMGSIEESST